MINIQIENRLEAHTIVWYYELFNAITTAKISDQPQGLWTMCGFRSIKQNDLRCFWVKINPVLSLMENKSPIQNQYSNGFDRNWNSMTLNKLCELCSLHKWINPQKWIHQSIGSENDDWLESNTPHKSEFFFYRFFVVFFFNVNMKLEFILWSSNNLKLIQ